MEPERWASAGSEDIPINLVMVVEDDADSAEVIRQILLRLGLKVRIAKDGGQAQATFSMQKPDFVILDLILPSESGYEICERLKHTDPTIPILVVTAIDLPDSRSLAERVGADGYVTKPYDPKFLISKMKEVTRKVWERNHLGEDKALSLVRFTCTCGKKFKVSSTHRGRSMTCPQCGEPLLVPRA
ncbi:MAG: response regulator [Planctomycetes bacterium]|nr:response regulator [Planctomycetota bacterium]